MVAPETAPLGTLKSNEVAELALDVLSVADAALSVHTVYFMPDLAATLTDLARVLRPGGLLVLACRTSDAPVPGWMDPAVYQVPTASHLIGLLNSAGYEGVDRQVVEGDPEALHLFTARAGTKSRPS